MGYLNRNHKIAIIVVVLVVVVLAGTVAVLLQQQPPQQTILRQDNLGGKYNPRFDVLGPDLIGYENGHVVYTKDGVVHTGYYNTYLNASMDWIRTNTSSDAVFLTWWDYGHAVVACGERDSVVKNPSQEALTAVSSGDRSSYPELDSNEKITDVAVALTATDENATKTILQKYGATYLLVTNEDAASKVFWYYKFAGLNSTDYLSDKYGTVTTFSSEEYTALGQQTMIYKLWVNSDLNYFTQVYSDANVKIYKLN